MAILLLGEVNDGELGDGSHGQSRDRRAQLGDVTVLRGAQLLRSGGGRLRRSKACQGAVCRGCRSTAIGWPNQPQR